MKSILKASFKTKRLKEKLALSAKTSLLRTRIKVKLDHRTTIMINRPSSLKVWQKLYPLAQIIK
jgi:hypothetical protein